MSIPTIQLDSPGSGGIPAAKFPEVGSSVVVGIVNVEDSQRYSMDGKPQFWDDGNPQLYKRVTGLVVSANGAVTGKDGEERPLEAGELVTFHCHGGRHFTWKEAVDTAGAANVGDVMRWTFTETKPPKQSGFSPQKVYVAQIRRAEANDGDLPARCVQEYQRMQQAPQVQSASAPAAQTQQAPAAHLEEPF